MNPTRCTIFFFMSDTSIRPTTRMVLFQTTSTPAINKGRLKIRLYLNNPQKVMPSNTNTPNTIAAA